MAKGVIYILTNPLFPEYVNIGYAMYLVGLIETRVNVLVQFPERVKYREKFSNKGFANIKKE